MMNNLIKSKECISCKKSYRPSSNRQLYCVKCKHKLIKIIRKQYRINFCIKHLYYEKKGIRKIKRNIRWNTRKRNSLINKFCENCKIKKAKIRHHIDYDIPNKILFLCHKCHLSIHRMRWLE